MDMWRFDGQAFVIAKMGRVFSFGCVHVTAPKEWSGTRIAVSGGTLGPGYTVPGYVLHYLRLRARNLRRLERAISPRQLKRIEQDYAKDPASVEASDTMQATRQDVRLFGRVAFRWDPEEPDPPGEESG